MLSLSKISSSEDAVGYYARYALEEGEAEGKWIGSASRVLGLHGHNVTESDFRCLLLGQDQNGEILLAKSERHTPGWDLTFSAPKSVSVVWAVAGDETRDAIEKAQSLAVEDALRYIEEYSSFSRIGKGGRDFVQSKVVCGAFQHSSNRDKEPQLHTHMVLCNVAQGRDGKWRTLDSRHVYKDQRAISASYKVSLCSRLQQMGFEIEITDHSFEISGVPQSVRDYFSSRSQAVESALSARGLDRSTASRELKEALTLRTREKKESGSSHIESARDFDRWKIEAEGVGFGPDSVGRLLECGRNCQAFGVDLNLNVDDLIDASAREVTDERSVFEGHHLHSKMGENLIGKASFEDFFHAVGQSMSKESIRTIGREGPRTRYSTQEMIDIEGRIYREIRRRSHEGKHIVREKSLSAVLSKDFSTIQDEQLQALRAATTSRSGVTIIQGVAGAGKSYTMRAVRAAFEQDGFFVCGVAPTNKAARELQDSTDGMDTSSIDALFGRLERGSITLSQRSVLIVDEAGMLGSRKFENLLATAGKVRAKVILLGDSRQIQPIEAGQVFGAIHRRFGSQELKTVVRQKGEEAKMLLLLREGTSIEDFGQVVSFLDREKRLCIEKSAHETMNVLVGDYFNFIKQNVGLSPLVVASRNDSVSKLNSMIRDRLKSDGYLQGGQVLESRSGRAIELAVGDRIIFTDNKKWSGIYRSDFATVKSLRGSEVEVLRSDGKEIKFDFRKFSSIEHGYAVTAHRSQGTTVDRAFVYADGSFMDKEKTYVALTRGRSGNRLYADRESLGAISWEESVEIGKLSAEKRDRAILDLYKARLVNRISRSGEKDSTLNYTRSGAYFQDQAKFSGLLDKLRDFGERLSGRKSVAIRPDGIEKSASAPQLSGGRDSSR